MPIWIRCPAQGLEPYSGLTRPKLYELAAHGKIRSVTTRTKEQTRGCRLFHLQSILSYLESLEVQPSTDPNQSFL
jgi:hypothetical protein